jgi:hypothetical protein
LTSRLLHSVLHAAECADDGNETWHAARDSIARLLEMAVPPTVIYPLTLPALLNHVLATQSSSAPTLLIVCSSREDFLQDLLYALQLQHSQAENGLQQLITPTLHNLFTAQHVRVSFCASVQALLAYLTAYAGATSNRGGEGERGAGGRIVLVNPLSLHAPSPSFSAQGLSRMFAAAVEAAFRVDAALVIAECPREAQPSNHHDREGLGETAMETEEEHARGESQEDLWEQEVSILNISAKKFGSGNADRAWAGRTIKVKRIAARWCQFRELGDTADRQQLV